MWVIMVTFLLLLAHVQAYTFFVLTDIHLDLGYSPDYNTTARCHSVGVAGKNLTIVPAPDVAESGRVGCDSPITLLESALEKMREVDDNPGFVLVTGDVIGHDTYKLLLANGTYDKSYTSQLVRSTFSQVTASLNSYFPTTQILFALGNNDGYGDYQLPSSPLTSYLYSLWAPLNPTLPPDFTTNSYYSCTVSVIGQKLIVLSTNFFGISVTAPKTAPIEQLLWLENELKTAVETGQRVVIAMHIPPGVGIFQENSYDWREEFIEQFYTVVKGYAQGVDFVFAAHQHESGFELIEGTNLAIVIHPALSPIYNNNPGFRYYEITETTQEYTDFFYDLLGGRGEWDEEIVFSEFTGRDEFDYRGVYEELMGDEAMLMDYLVASHGYSRNINVDISASDFVQKVMGLQSEAELFRAALCSYRYLLNVEFDLCIHHLLPLL